MRTVEELETAGVAALTIEDTLLPVAFGGEGEGLISTPEMLGKLRAAVAARQDPSLVIIGRTSALRHGGIDEAVRRLQAYQDTGVDAFFIVGARERAEIEAIHAATSLPLMLGGSPAALWSDLPFLNAHRVRIALQGHAPFYAAAQAVYDVLKHLKAGGAPADLKTPVAAGDVLATALRQDAYAGWQDSYLR
jgi:carboxyvinyl-carboxyphosphonate phosphorylmutase